MTALPKLRRATDKHLTDAASGIAGLQKEIIDIRQHIDLLLTDNKRLCEQSDANRQRAEKAEAALSASEGLVAVLREAAEELYTECHGPDETGERHLCNHCGVDVSMRGMEAEATEHDERCPAGKLAKALSTPATRTLGRTPEWKSISDLPPEATMNMIHRFDYDMWLADLRQDYRSTPAVVWGHGRPELIMVVEPPPGDVIDAHHDAITRPAAAGEGT